MDRGTWYSTVHGAAESRTRLSDLAHTHAIGLYGAAGHSVFAVYSWTRAAYFLLGGRPPHDRRGELLVFYPDLHGGERGCQHFTWYNILSVHPRPMCQHFPLF